MADATPEGYDPSKDPKRMPLKSNDPGWKYTFYYDLKDKNHVQCKLCGKHFHGGIKRAKQHLVGGYGDVSKCPNTTTKIAKVMQQALENNKRNKPIQLDENDEVQEVQASNVPHDSISHAPSSGTASKRARSFFDLSGGSSNSQPPQTKSIVTKLRKSPEEVVAERHRKGTYQTTIESRVKSKDEKERVYQHIADFFYETGIPFNAVTSRSFEIMIESVGQYGPGLIPPSFHDLRVSLLAKAKAKTEELKQKYTITWNQFGCTLMSDGWTDKRGRHLINFIINCPTGTYFMGSVDASSQCQDATMLADLLDEKIKEIGTDKVVQVITDNASNYKAAGNILMEKRPTLFWTPCAAHCLDLILEDIGNLKNFKSAIARAKKITTFIYRHGRLLDTMRQKTNGRDLVRPGVTRFATSFLTLQSLCKYKDALRQLFVSDDWTRSKLSATEAGKKIYETILSTQFWNHVEDCVRASQPLLVVLRIVDGDEKPAMPELYAAMEYAKKKIKEFLVNKQRLCKCVLDIIDRRWATQMEQKLYGAALFLNPGKYFNIKDEEHDLAYKLRGDFNSVLSKMVPEIELVDKISEQADAYDESRNDFGQSMAVRQRGKKRPIDWWNAFGGCAIELAKFAKRIVGLCCSSSGCERNWSTFESIHTKKRNRLEHQRLNDLVYVQYNHRIIARFEKIKELEDKFDPLILDDFDWGSEWIVPEADVVHPGDNLTWDMVGRVANACEGATSRNLRRTVSTYTRRDGNDASNSRTVARGLVDEEDEEERPCDTYDGDEEEMLPSDDEHLDDDYGVVPTNILSDDDSLGDADKLVFDEFA